MRTDRGNNIRKVILVIVFTGLSGLIAGCDGRAPADTVEDGGPTLSALLGAAREPGFAEALVPRELRFPEDHGPHPEYRNEWWYFTGNLEAAGGRRFGYELTLFRFRLAPGEPQERVSNWATEQAFVAHLAVTDVAGERFHVAERHARGALGLAGADRDPLRVWLYDWSIHYRPSLPGTAWQLQASDPDFGVSLTLTPEREPVLHGDRGLSQKSSRPGNASYYYSVPRLATDGALTIGDSRFEVTGSSWLDREWSSSALAPAQQGWDWFSLQLGSGSDLMYYRLRQSDGSRDPHSAGTWMPAEGTPRHLAAADACIEVLDTWDSPANVRYPIEWRMIVPAALVDLRIRPVLANQELDTWVRYWEGAVDVTGTEGAQRVSGRGYVEMTGYTGTATPVRESCNGSSK